MVEAFFAIIADEEQRCELEKFYIEHKNRLYHIAFSYLHNSTDAEDAVQETFSRIVDIYDKFDALSKSDKIRYSKTIVRNVSIDFFNNKIKITPIEITEDFPDNEVEIENMALGAVNYAAVKDFIKTLPRNWQDVILLHCIWELTLKETASQLNISPSTVKKYLLYARKAIRKFLDGDDGYE